MIERIKEFVLNVVAGVIAIPATLFYMCVCIIAVIIKGFAAFCSEFKELLIVALMVLLIIDGAHYSTGVSIAIVVIFAILCIVWSFDDNDG